MAMVRVIDKGTVETVTDISRKITFSVRFRKIPVRIVQMLSEYSK